MFRAYLAVSLDGFIADRAGGVEWLDPYFTPEIDFSAFWRTIGATVMGRTSYDWTVKHNYQNEGDGVWIVQTHRKIRRLPRGVECYSGDVRDLAARLRRELAGTGKDVCLFGGGRSIATFQRHALVDRWELALIPVLLGRGVPLFRAHSRGSEALGETKGSGVFYD